MKEVLTHDVGLGANDRRLCSGSLTLQGGESDFGSIKGELQAPRLIGGHRKLPMSLVHLVDEPMKLSMAA